MQRLVERAGGGLEAIALRTTEAAERLTRRTHGTPTATARTRRLRTRSDAATVAACAIQRVAARRPHVDRRPTHEERHVAILPNLHGPADLRGLDDAQLDAARRRDPRDDHRHRRPHRRPPRQLARRRRADDRAAPAARVAARPDRLGHRPPGLPAQAADRPARAVRDAPPAGRRRRLPAAQRSRRTTSSTAATPARACRSPRASPRRATCATASSGSRSSSATRR